MFLQPWYQEDPYSEGPQEEPPILNHAHSNVLRLRGPTVSKLEALVMCAMLVTAASVIVLVQLIPRLWYC